MFASDEMTPSAPDQSAIAAMRSLPWNTLKPSDRRARNRSKANQSPAESLMPTMFGCSARRPTTDGASGRWVFCGML